MSIIEVSTPGQLDEALKDPRAIEVHVIDQIDYEPGKRGVELEPVDFKLLGNGLLTTHGSIRLTSPVRTLLDNFENTNIPNGRDAMLITGAPRGVTLSRYFANGGGDETVSVTPGTGAIAQDVTIRDSVILPDPNAIKGDDKRHDYGSLFRDCLRLRLERVIYGPGLHRFPKVSRCPDAVLINVLALGVAGNGLILQDRDERPNHPLPEGWESKVRVEAHGCLWNMTEGGEFPIYFWPGRDEDARCSLEGCGAYMDGDPVAYTNRGDLLAFPENIHGLYLDQLHTMIYDCGPIITSDDLAALRLGSVELLDSLGLIRDEPPSDPPPPDPEPPSEPELEERVLRLEEDLAAHRVESAKMFGRLDALVEDWAPGVNLRLDKIEDTLKRLRGWAVRGRR